MLKLNPARKNKIDLADYDCKRDIEHRLLMSEFSVFDVAVIEEILHSSLTIEAASLADALDEDVSDVFESLNKLKETGLFKLEGSTLSVDKEIRRYYEGQLPKFDDKFRPDMEFLQDLLAKVPIHVLPIWYSIPRTSTNIFESIIEKFLETPQVYKRYLVELGYGDPIMTGIMNDVFEAPAFKVRARDLKAKYNLSREEFEEYMLHLEFNFICCLSYNKVGDQWKEVVTPFAEWKDHMQFRYETQPKSVENQSGVVPYWDDQLTFAKDALCLMSELEKAPLSVSEQPAPAWYRLDESSLDKLKSVLRGPTNDAQYIGWLLRKLTSLNLIGLKEGSLVLQGGTADWLNMSPEDFGLNVYRHTGNRFVSVNIPHQPRTDRDLRGIEKGLSRVADLGWIKYDDFLKTVTAPIRGASEVVLCKRGRRWAYARPEYNAEQLAFIRGAIFERFAEAGFIEMGDLDGVDVFRVSPFGKTMLSLP